MSKKTADKSADKSADKLADKSGGQAWQGWLIEKLIVFLSWLPLSVVRLLARGFALLSYWLPNDHRRVALKNLQVAYPQLSASERQKLLKQNLISCSQTFAELGAMWCWPKDKLLKLIKEVFGEEHLHAALNQHKGVIFIAPHIGNWELIGPYLSTRYPSTFLYRPPNVPSVEAFMVKSRGRFGAKLAPTDARGVRTLMQALSNNEVTVILPDQDPGASGGVYAPFFNRPARTMTLFSKLLQKTNSASVCVVMQRLPGLSAGYRLNFLPVPQGIDSQDAEVAATALNQAVENCIHIAPEQYLWSYKRYRKPPPDLADIYKRTK